MPFNFKNGNVVGVGRGGNLARQYSANMGMPYWLVFDCCRCDIDAGMTEMDIAHICMEILGNKNG